jgi:hypothetical protein
MDDYKLIDMINDAIDTGDYTNIIIIFKKPYNFSENIKKLALNICQELLVEKIDEL